MIRKEQQGVHWLEFELLNDVPKLKHAILLRHGGFSQGSFSSLNVSKSMGDITEAVESNRLKIQKVFQLPSLCIPKQIHSSDILQIDTLSTRSQLVGDGLVTAAPCIPLMVTHADCQVALFYDPVQHVAAAVHCGWRGQVQNIYKNTIEKLKKLFFSKPENLLVGISPSLGPQSAEFTHYRHELPESFWAFQINPNYFNFWEISRWQLETEGILPHHIQIAEIDTRSTPEDYFSYRREKISGRHGSFIELG